MGRHAPLLALSVLGTLLAGCRPLVDVDGGRSEVEPGLRCYDWTTSVLRSSRTQRSPEFATFSEGDLYLGGTPTGDGVLRAQGRVGTVWTASAGAFLNDDFFSDFQPGPDGGVLVLSRSRDAIVLASVDASGEPRPIAEFESKSASTAWNLDPQVRARAEGFVIASLEESDPGSTVMVVRALDAAGAIAWTRTAEVVMDDWVGLRAFVLDVDDAGTISIAFSDVAAAAAGDAHGLHLLRLADDGEVLADVSMSLDAPLADVAFRGQGELTVLTSGSDFVEIRHLGPHLQPVWTSQPREGQDIIGHSIAWDPYTERSLMVGENRADGGRAYGWFLVLTGDGNVEWSHTASGEVGVATRSPVADPDGGFVMPESRSELRLRQFVPTTCD